jgi:biopolymer transport protein ExbB
MQSSTIIGIFDAIPLWVMLLPIILCSILSLAVIIERIVFFSRIKLDYTQMVESVRAYCSGGNIQDARRVCENYTGPVVEMMKKVLGSLSGDESRQRVVSDYSDRAIRGIEKNIGVIATVATIAPMFGLLGTVTGMMKSFSGLSRVGPMAQDLLAYGIAEALITTAFGLLVAIPSWIFYNYLVSRAEYYVREVEYVANSAMTLPGCNDK